MSKPFTGKMKRAAITETRDVIYALRATLDSGMQQHIDRYLEYVAMNRTEEIADDPCLFPADPHKPIMQPLLHECLYREVGFAVLYCAKYCESKGAQVQRDMWSEQLAFLVDVTLEGLDFHTVIEIKEKGPGFHLVSNEFEDMQAMKELERNDLEATAAMWGVKLREDESNEDLEKRIKEMKEVHKTPVIDGEAWEAIRS
jgi:hypothetical protein